MTLLYSFLFLAVVKLTEKVKPMAKGLRFSNTTGPSVHVAEQDSGIP
jgi:hypothetical protein